ncbi:hypothetical protein [Rhodococcus sp. PSBB049]|uniref:hypothetical protein n=1 Tax=Rhodococcus sp. PSBB049 TaxID=2812863 RepID=UPI00197F5847|nr:hypothetical protein [Rhodococcus sp. PSBB049]QSE72457.1 hypothetical protein JYA91_29470 [Rhodococcus sp. PSBB049]
MTLTTVQRANARLLWQSYQDSGSGNPSCETVQEMMALYPLLLKALDGADAESERLFDAAQFAQRRAEHAEDQLDRVRNYLNLYAHVTGDDTGEAGRLLDDIRRLVDEPDAP